MRVLSFIDDEFTLTGPDNAVEKVNGEIDPNRHYDIAVYDILTLIDFEDARENIDNKSVYRIAVIDGTDDLPAFENYKTDAWIYRDKLDQFQKLLDTAIERSYI
jgi:hypothetical protein